MIITFYGLNKMYHNTSSMNDIKNKIYEYYDNTKRDLDISTNIKNESVWSYLQMVGCIQDLKYQYDFSIEDMENAFNDIIHDENEQNEQKQSIFSVHVNPQIIKDVFQHMKGFYDETTEDELGDTETDMETKEPNSKESVSKKDTTSDSHSNSNSDSDSEPNWKKLVHDYLKSIIKCILSFIEKIKFMLTNVDKSA